MTSKVSGINSLVLVSVAFSSLLSMFALTRIDSIVHQDLYRYGLRFSYEWAMPYWTMTTLVFAMGWFNIGIMCAFQFYMLLFARKEAERIPQKEPLEPETTYQPLIDEKPIQAEEDMFEEPTAEDVRTTEATEEESVMAVEERREETETLYEVPPEEAPPQEYIVTEEPEEVEVQREQEAEPIEAAEDELEPEERYEEPQEPVDVYLPEETSYTEEEERESEEMWKETQETPSPAQETEAETIEREETQWEEPELTEHSA